MPEVTQVRIDKWLWSVRLFKTRSMATTACNAGKVKIDGNNVKPSRMLKIGEEVQVQLHRIKKTVKVIALLDKRVGAKLVPDYMDDLTSPEEYKKLEALIHLPLVKRDKGAGRPTKKDRRDIDKLYI